MRKCRAFSKSSQPYLLSTQVLNITPYAKEFDEIKTQLSEIKSQLQSLILEIKRLKFEGKGPYLNPEHPLFSPELESAVSVWMDLFAPGQDVKGRGDTSKKLINRWLKENRPKLSVDAKSRIEILANPEIYKRGGAQKMES